MTAHDVIDELREQLRVALDRIDTLERELEARRRAERDKRLSSAVDRPKRRPLGRRRLSDAQHGVEPVRLVREQGEDHQ
jgi:hypothetical protein